MLEAAQAIQFKIGIPYIFTTPGVVPVLLRFFVPNRFSTGGSSWLYCWLPSVLEIMNLQASDIHLNLPIQIFIYWDSLNISKTN